MILKFRVEGQTLFPLPTNDIPREGSRDYLKVDFDFGCGTEAYTKTVYFTSEAEGEEAPFSTAVVYEGDPIRVDDYFAQKSFAVSVGFVLGERSYTTNEVSVPLDPASDVWLNLPPKPDIPAYQQLVNLAENAATSADSAAKDADSAAKDAADASTSADSAAKDAAEAANAANEALQAVKASGYVDVTEAYRSNDDYRDQPEEYLRSLGSGKWMINDDKVLYKMDVFTVNEQEWRIEQVWTDDGIYTLRMVNEGREIVYCDSADEELRVNGSVIAPSGGGTSCDCDKLPRIYVQLTEPTEAPDGSVWIVPGGNQAQEADKLYIQAEEPVNAQDGSVWIVPGGKQGSGVSRTEMEKYVAEAINAALAAIPVGEEMLFG